MILIELAKRQMMLINDLIDETTCKLATYSDLPHRTLVLRIKGVRTERYYEQKWDHGIRILTPLGSAKNEKVISYKRQRYLHEKLKILLKDKKSLEKLLKNFKDYSYGAIQKNLPASYKGLSESDYEKDVGKIIASKHSHLPDTITKDERFQTLVKWANAPYKRNPYPLPKKPNIARDGTPMRSKGECMWYDDILFEELPFRTEPEIIIQGKSGQWHKFYPDFVFLCFDGTLIFVEHFGDLGNDEYAESNKRKIQEYLDCDIVLGDNLIVTSDNADHHTNEVMITDALSIIKRHMFA